MEQNLLSRVPDVPLHLVWDGDIAAFPHEFDDPYVGVAEALHAGPDIVWAARNAQFGRPGWLLTRHALLQEVYMDPERFPARFNRGASDMLGMEMPLLPFESDPPDHRHYRQMLQPWFQPSAITALDGTVRSVCTDLMNGFAEKGGCEFFSEFSSLFPSHIFIRMFGLPTELVPQFLEWEHGFLGGETIEERVAATHAIHDCLKSYCERKRQNPEDDLISAIVQGSVQGRPLTDVEIQGMCFLLYSGGLDTVTNSLGWHLRHLAMDQELQSRLRNDPSLIPAAVEELLRAYPVSNTNRTVAHDMEFHGVSMRKGDIVALPIMLAARDPLAYPDPHRVDIDRKARHLTFGTGIHNCLGIHLARREIRIVLAEFLSRFRSIRLAEDDRPQFDFSVTWGVKRLALVLE